MKKKIIISLIIIASLITLAFFGISYLNKYYLPQKIRVMITQELSKSLNAAVQLQDVRLSLAKGLILTDLKISKINDPVPVLQIKSLSAGFLIIPSFKQRKIILPSINIDSPQIEIIRYQDNKFNIQDFLPKATEGKKSPLPILVSRINVNNADVTFKDQALSPNLEQNINLDNLEAQLTPWGINFKIKGKLIQKDKSSSLNLEGKFQFSTKELTANAQIDKIDLTNYLPYYPNLPITIESFLLNDIDAELNFKDSALSVKSNAFIKGVYIEKDEASIANANAKLDALVKLDINNINELYYLISIDQLNANISAPQISEDAKVTYAKLEISPDKLKIEDVKLDITQNVANIKGELSNFANPIFNININADADVSFLQQILKNYIVVLEVVIAEGKSNIDIELGKADKKDIEFKGTLNLKDASLKLKDKNFQINQINGLINFDKENASWRDLTFKIFDEPLKSNAEIANFNLPKINLELKNENINIKTKVNTIQKNVFNIEYLNANYYNSTLNMDGKLNISGQDYYTDINVDGEIDASDLEKIKYIPGENIAKAAPEGKCKLLGKISGNIKNPKTLNASIALNSDDLKIYGLRVKNISGQINQELNQLKIPQSNYDFYGGTISINGLVDLEKQGYPYALNIIFDNIDLSKLKMDTPLKDKEFEGILISNIILSGNLTALQDVKGQGNFLIKDGYLWEFNPLNKLRDFLFIPRTETLIFKEAKGDFNIGDEKVSTENLVLTSKLITLDCEGSADFKGNLDFEITPYPVEQTEQTEEQKSIINQDLIRKLAGISFLRVTGTIQKPEIKPQIATKEIFDKVKEKVKGAFGAIKDITGMIFDGEE